MTSIWAARTHSDLQASSIISLPSRNLSICMATYPPGCGVFRPVRNSSRIAGRCSATTWLGSSTRNREPQSAHDETVAGQVIEIWRWPIKTSSPERAILEVLDELPNRGSFHNVDMMFEGLTSLRPNPLTALLVACRSIKVRRLFFVFADRHRHAWLNHIDTSRIDFGSGPRALVEGGKLHPKYRIYVPADLLASPDAEDNFDA